MNRILLGPPTSEGRPGERKRLLERVGPTGRLGKRIAEDMVFADTAKGFKKGLGWQS